MILTYQKHPVSPKLGVKLGVNLLLTDFQRSWRRERYLSRKERFHSRMPYNVLKTSPFYLPLKYCLDVLSNTSIIFDAKVGIFSETT